MLGKAQVIKKGKDLAIISIGGMLGISLDTASLLANKRIDSMVIDARFIKPLDAELLEDVCANIKRIVTIEDGVLEGGRQGAREVEGRGRGGHFTARS